MKLEQLPSGSYRVKKIVNGKTYRITFKHKPTQAEILSELSRLVEEQPTDNDKFKSYVSKYIESKENILSPTTIISYKQLSRAIPAWFENKKIYDITQMDVQMIINEHAKDHSPKTVKNYHGLIVSVLKAYRPNMAIHTTLPKNKPIELTIPKHEEITKILQEAEGTEFHIVFQLGCLGLRKGEILALTLADLHGDCITIDKCMVITEDGSYRVKNLPKTVSSVRKVYIPDELADEIRAKGYIYQGNPQQILRTLHRIQDKLNIPRCRFHDLRHYFVSYAHSLGWSNADIISVTGHKTDDIAVRVYRHSMAEKEQKKSLANQMFK